MDAAGVVIADTAGAGSLDYDFAEDLAVRFSHIQLDYRLHIGLVDPYTPAASVDADTPGVDLVRVHRLSDQIGCANSEQLAAKVVCPETLQHEVDSQVPS